MDEPLQALARQPWAVRDLIPFGSDGSVRLLDSVQSTLEAGRGSPGLAPFLARGGVRFLVVRNDLDPQRAGALYPVYVRHVLAQSEGLRLVATFGPKLRLESSPDRLVPTIDLDGEPYHAIDVYRVEPATSLVRTYPFEGTTVVNGATESLLQLADRGRLGDGAFVLAADAAAVQLPTEVDTVLTDQPRRVAVDFGYVDANQSYALTPSEDPAGSSTSPRQRLSFQAGGNVAVARIDGIREVTASTYGSKFRIEPGAQPFAAVDGDVFSAWEAHTGDPGEWIEVGLLDPISVSAIEIQLLEDYSWRPAITRLRVTTAAGSRTQSLDRTQAWQRVQLPRGATSWIRLSIEKSVATTASSAGAGIREIRIPGVNATRSLVVPSTTQDGRAPQMIAFDRRVSDPYDPSRRNEEPVLRRDFETTTPAAFDVTGTAVTRPDLLTLSLMTTASSTGDLRVKASTSWANLPQYLAQNALDGDPGTSWIARVDDIQPILELAWDERRAIDEILVAPAAEPTNTPTEVVLRGEGGVQRRVHLDRRGHARFRTIMTRRLRVQAVKAKPNAAARSATSFGTPVAVGASEILFPSIADLRQPHADFESPFSSQCGSGPLLTVDGQSVPTRVEGTLRDVLYVRPLSLAICDGPLQLGSGRHRVAVVDNGLFGVAALTFSNTQRSSNIGPLETGGETRRVRVKEHDQTTAVLELEPGARSYLAFGQNYNEGWEATLNGRALEPLRLEGWQQAWIVPSGEGGDVRVRFAPDRLYRWGLFAGLAAVAGLVVLAAVPRRRGREGPMPPVHPTWPTRRVGWGDGMPLPAAAVLAVVVGGVLGGLVGAFIPAVLLVFDPRRVLPWVAGGAIAIGGVISACLPAGSSTVGALSPIVNLLAIVAMSAVLLALGARRPRQERARRVESPESLAAERGVGAPPRR
jgi:arabinofuranan 3-O-arabinosyltransferase